MGRIPTAQRTADMNELAAMARKAQSDAMAAITQRAQQSIEEMKKFSQRQ